MKHRLLPFLLIFSAALSAQNATQSLQNFLNTPELRQSNIGIYIKNNTTGQVIADFRSEHVIPPASTQKILTSATALCLLGSDFRFSTFLETDGTIEDGTLKGNLYIRGTGDPTLGSQKVGDQMFLYKWVQALRKKGIRRIEGSVISDASFFDGDAVNPQWIWEDIGNYYAPGIFALPYLDNTMNVQLRSAAIGSVAEVVKTFPEVEGMIFENHIRCTEITYDGAYVHGLPYSNVRYLTGSVPSNRGIFGVKGDLPNPPLLLAKHFTNRLREGGIEVTEEPGYMTETNNSTRQLLYTHLSEPLSEILREVNQNSNNLYAEQIYRYLGSMIATPCTLQNSLITMQNCWRNRGISLQNTFIFDGCGLAPQDAVSAQTLVRILDFMLHSTEKDVFFLSLPVAGESGTLKNFLAKTPLQGKVVAKSGTTSRIKSYAGYITLKDESVITFAIIVNNANCKARKVQTLIENYLVELFGHQC